MPIGDETHCVKCGRPCKVTFSEQFDGAPIDVGRCRWHKAADTRRWMRIFGRHPSPRLAAIPGAIRRIKERSDA